MAMNKTHSPNPREKTKIAKHLSRLPASLSFNTVIHVPISVLGCPLKEVVHHKATPNWQKKKETIAIN